jgi:DNA-binding Lrp family transcriptional regulator
MSMMNAANLFAPVFAGIQKSKMEKMEKILQEMEEYEEGDVEEIYELTFEQKEFDNILKNEYNTFAKVPFDTEEEWEYVMTENTQIEPDEEIKEDDEDEFYSDDEILI